MIRHTHPLHHVFLATVLLNAVIGVIDIIAASFFLYSINLDANLGAVLFSKIHLLISSMPEQSQHFIILYFYSHGIIKLFLAFSLFENKLWAYPLAFICFFIFSIYQVFPTYLDPSPLNIALLLLNVTVLLLVSVEHRHAKRALYQI